MNDQKTEKAIRAAITLLDGDLDHENAETMRALLSKLRAEGVQASFLLEEALGYIRMFSNPGATAEEMTAIAQAGLRRFTAALASAPVAGEAYQGDNVAERLDNMADDQPPGSQAQSDLYAAATIWRKHIAHRAAPQASEEVRKAIETCAKICDGRSASLMKSQMLTASNEAHKCGMAIRFRAGELMSLTPASEAVRPSRDPDLEQLK